MALAGVASQIVVRIRRDISVEFSAHAAFTADSVVARVTARTDWGVNDPSGLVLMHAY